MIRGRESGRHLLIGRQLSYTHSATRRRRIVVYSTALERRHTERYREFESHRLRQNSEFKFPPKIWSARSAVCSAFPPQNPDSAKIRHAPRGSKSTVRSLI